MADAVSTVTLHNSRKYLVVKLLNKSDGTGESNVVKVDKSTFTGLNGLEPTKIVIDKILYDCSGMQVTISYDHTSDVNIAHIGGFGCLDYTDAGGLPDSGSGQTGDILFTTTNHSSGDTYDITLYCRKKD